MKKWLMAGTAVLLAWNVWLTGSYLDLKKTTETTPSEQPDTMHEGGTTIVHTTVSGYTTDVTKTVEKAYASIVNVQCSASESTVSATGVVYRTEGEDMYILSDAQIVQEEGIYSVRFDSGSVVNAELIGFDSLTSLAVLRVQCDFIAESMSMGDSALVTPGEYVVLPGSRTLENQSGSLSFGVVSLPAQIERTGSDGSRWLVRSFSTDAGSLRSCNGAPLLNMAGEMIGMQSAGLGTTSGFTSCVAVNEVKTVAEEIIKDGEVTRGYLGIVARNVKDLQLYQKSQLNLSLDVNSGVVVMNMSEDAPARSAGLLVSDVVIGLDDQTIETLDDLYSALYSRIGGDEAELIVVRKDEQIKLHVVLS